MAGLSIAGQTGLTTETSAPETTTTEKVTETAPIPPQPIITPEVPLSATATDLPAPTPGEKTQAELINGGA